MLKYVIVLLSMLFLFACSQNSIKEDAKAPADNNAIQDPHGTPDGKPMKKKIVVPTDVAQKYKSIIISVTDKKTQKKVDTEIVIGQKVDVAGTSLKIEVESYLPDFVMDGSGIMTSKSVEEANPAVKVKIINKDTVFDGWLFKNFPDMHPYENQEYDVILVGAAKK